MIEQRRILVRALCFLTVATVLVGLTGIQPVQGSQPLQPHQDGLRPLGDMLNPDGSLDLANSSSGVFDPTG